MALFSKKQHDPIANVIRCDEPSYLIWKWHPVGTVEGESKRENTIRWGSNLRIKEGSAAIFVYRQFDGTIQEAIEGPYDGILQTLNLPIISEIVGKLYGGDSPFQAEVYFINLARIIQNKFAVPFFDVYDPRYPDFGVPVAVRGSISFQITDYTEFIKLHRLETFSVDDFQAQIKDAVSQYVKDWVANAPINNNVPVIQIERMIAPINDAVEHDLGYRLFRDFGVTVSGIDISSIEVDKTSEGYRQLLAITKDLAAMMAKAETEVRIKDMQDTQRINAQDTEARLKAQREEVQYAQHLQTQKENITVHQINQQAAVGIAGAEGLGKMGSCGTMDASGMNPVTMIAGMAIGGAIGQNIAGTVSGIMAGVNQSATGAVPPPIPAVTYYVVANGQATGPFDVTALRKKVSTGSLTKESLVWKQGMTGWEQAGDISDLKMLFNTEPPSAPA